MRILLLTFLLLLSACGSVGDTSSANHGYGFEYDVQGTTGLKLRYTPTLTAADPLSNPIFVENIYAQVQACTGMSAPPPFVIMVAAGSLPNNWIGETQMDPSLVLIGSTTVEAPSVMRHELIHHLLGATTGNLDAGHTNNFFKPRADGGCA